MAYVIQHIAGCPIVAKASIAALYNDVSVKTEVTEAKAIVGHPLKKCPVLLADGKAIFESNAMARFVARANGDAAKLYGASAFEAGQVDSWIDFASGEIDAPITTWVNTISGKIPNVADVTKKAIADARKILMALDSHLANKTFLVRDRLTLADIVVVNSLLPGYKGLFDPGFRKSLKNVNRWFLTCVHQPHFAAVLGQVDICEKKPVAPAPEKNEEEKKEEKKEKKAPAPEAAPAPKKVKPFSNLPPSPFIMDEFKVAYSNEDTRTVALPYLYEHFDKEGYCLYNVEYKYPEDLQKLFMVSNLLGGFCQRVEGIRNHICGSFLIFGEENNYEIHGVVLLRSKEFPHDVMDEIPDTESYKFTPVDLTNAEQKEFFEDVWAWEGKFGGKTFTDAGKVMK